MDYMKHLRKFNEGFEIDPKKSHQIETAFRKAKLTHPEYLAASLEELESMRAGDMNFGGAIPDYKPIK